MQSFEISAYVPRIIERSVTHGVKIALTVVFALIAIKVAKGLTIWARTKRDSLPRSMSYKRGKAFTSDIQYRYVRTVISKTRKNGRPSHAHRHFTESASPSA